MGVGSTALSVGIAITARDMFSAIFSKAEKDLVKLRKVSEAEADKLERSLRIGEKITKAGGIITGAAFMIDKAFQPAIETSNDFSQAIANIGTLMQTKGVKDTKAYKAALQENIQKASQLSGKSMIELGNSAYPLVSGIQNADEALAAIPYVAQLARGGMGSAESAVNTFTNTLNTFGAAWGNTFTPQQKAQRIANLYSVTIADAKTDLDQMNASMQYAGTAASAAGVPLETTLAILGKFQSAGMKGEQAGTNFRSMLGHLIAGADKLKKEFNVAVTDAQGNLRPLEQVFNDLNSAMKGMPTAEVQAKFQDIFGIEAANGALILAQLGGELQSTSDKYRQLADATGDSSIAFQMNNEAMKGGAAQAEALKAKQEALRIQLAEKLAPAQLKVKSAMYDAFNYIMDLPVVGEVAKWGAAFLGLAGEIGKVIGPATTLIGFLQQLKATKRISVALENKGVAEDTGKSIAGSFGTALAAIGITIGAATILNAIIEKARGQEARRTVAAMEAGGQAQGGFWNLLLKTQLGPLSAIQSAKEMFAPKDVKEFAAAKTQEYIQTQRAKGERVGGLEAAKAYDSYMLVALDMRKKGENASLESLNQEIEKRFQNQMAMDETTKALNNLRGAASGGAPVAGPALPSKQVGGYIPKTGAYLLHSGEKVIPRAQTQGGGQGGVVFHVTVNIQTPSADPDAVKRAVEEALAVAGRRITAR